MKSILVTGANGSIGSKICENLKKNYNLLKLVRFNNNNEKNTFTFKNIKNYKKKIDIIIHLAGYNPYPYLKLKSEKDLFKKNIEIHKNVIKIIKKNKVKKIIFFSSFSIYQKNKIINENTQLSTGDYYTKSKFWMERKLSNENISCYILRSPSIIFKDTGNNWISKIISKISNDEDIILYNKKNKYNNCLHITDLNKIIFKLINKKKYEKKIYNISSNKPVSVDVIKKIIKKNKYYSKKIIIKKNKSINDFFNDSQKIQKDLNIKFKSTYNTLRQVLTKDLRQKLIIFGSNGYLGSYFKKKLKKNYKIISINSQNIDSFFKLKNLNEIFSSSQILYLVLKNSKTKFLEANLKILNQIISKIPKDKIKKFFLIASTHSHNKLYVKFNKLREKIIKNKFKDKSYILCPGKVYGYKIIKSNYGINSFLNDVKKNELNIYGTGKNYCPHTYIEDLTTVTKLFLKNNYKPHCYYLYNDKKINFLNIAKKIKSFHKNNSKIKINFFGKSLNYKIKKPYNFKKNSFVFSDMNLNLKKIVNERKI